MLKVTKFYARSFDIDSLTIFWEIEDITKDDDIYAYEFTLSKCESPVGPYDVVFGPFQNLFTFRDSIHPENHKNRSIYYKLKIVDRRTNEEKEYGPTSQLPEPDLIALEIIRQEDVLFRGHIGRKCYLFPRKTFGARCVCFNQVLQRQEVGNCKTCFGVGYIGGFNTPISFYAQVDPNSRELQLTPNINHTVNVTTLRTISYPPIQVGDVIVDSENHRWISVGVRVTQRLKYDVHQEVTIKEVLRGDITYLLPVNDDIKKVEEIFDWRNKYNPTTHQNQPKPDYLGEHPDGLTY